MDELKIRSNINRTLSTTNLKGYGEPYRGKVRDVYRANDHLILVTTDRISAFDFIMRQPIPFKGQVLNQLAAYFFEKTADLVPNALLGVPDPNVSISIHCEAVPIEFVVRGYLAGHAWREYKSGKRVLCGKKLPEGLRQNSRLPEPILTPATKATTGHDEDTTREEILERGIMSADQFDHLEAMALDLFNRGNEMARERGLILVDTKYEFGRTPEGELVLIDEVNTPDSSRYFYFDTYEDLLKRDKPQRQLSKEFLREWLIANGFQGKEGDKLPDLPDDFRIQIASRYVELFEKVTGSEFVPDLNTNTELRIQNSVDSYFKKAVAQTSSS